VRDFLVSTFVCFLIQFGNFLIFFVWWEKLPKCHWDVAWNYYHVFYTTCILLAEKEAADGRENFIYIFSTSYRKADNKKKKEIWKIEKFQKDKFVCVCVLFFKYFLCLVRTVPRKWCCIHISCNFTTRKFLNFFYNSVRSYTSASMVLYWLIFFLKTEREKYYRTRLYNPYRDGEDSKWFFCVCWLVGQWHAVLKKKEEDVICVPISNKLLPKG
jgi:hypothetical protein